eukprot:TRINITY_DN2788_c0_g1_i1.p1 TRINITY_DN2788_c0_g1~~TRINITY_DN2788_c0_g1_i1.p1  ORF type:complete len:494 (+),score=86.52 TRINITY_DN2788_c0_g1_i1:87-1484(+)
MGRQIGHWRLKNTLGTGSFGEVRYAVHCETGQQAAVKICAKQMLAKGQGRVLLQREIATMKELTHPGILRLYEVLETTRHFYLVLELAAGGELFDLIQENKRFGDKTAKKYFQQLIAGVKYCHEQGIVHRDLKPQNLLITGNDELKIADFGFSNFQNLDQDGKVTPALRLQTQCGTPNYAAPEIFLGKGYDGFKTDIWSCGVILFVMLCGHVPFRPTGRVAGLQGVILSIVEGNYTIPDCISDTARDLISNILHPDIDKRFTVQQIIDHPWFAQESFDSSLLDSLPKIVITDEAVRNSIFPVVEEKEVKEEEDEPEPQAPVDAGVDAEPDVEIVDALPAMDSTKNEPKVTLSSELTEIIQEQPRPGYDQLGRSLKDLRVGGSAASLVATQKKPTTRTDHVFQRKHWHTPHWCFMCNKFIYGLGRQGFSCINCACPVHIKCVDVACNSSCEEFRAAGSPQTNRGKK